MSPGWGLPARGAMAAGPADLPGKSGFFPPVAGRPSIGNPFWRRSACSMSTFSPTMRMWTSPGGPITPVIAVCSALRPSVTISVGPAPAPCAITDSKRLQNGRNGILLLRKNQPLLMCVVNFIPQFLGYLLKRWRFHRQGYGQEWDQGMQEAFALLREGKLDRRPFRWRDLPHYLLMEGLADRQFLPLYLVSAGHCAAGFKMRKDARSRLFYLGRASFVCS